MSLYEVHVPGDSVCSWEGTEISSPFTPAPSTAVAGEDSSNVLMLTPASASQCHVLLRSWLSPGLVVGVGENISLSITFSSRTSTNDFFEDGLLQYTVRWSSLFVGEMGPSDSV